MTIRKELLQILACPKCVREPGCNGKLEYQADRNVLVCHHCKLMYPINEDIPVMLIDKALPLDE